MSKVFCIGLNKTGTTSLAYVLQELGYRLGDQLAGERLIREWFDGNFAPIIELTKTADAFQDIPFSCPNTYKHLYSEYPSAKYILTVRSDAEEWYNSLVRFHHNLFRGRAHSMEVVPPSSDDLKASHHIWQGWMYEVMHKIFNTPENEPYHKETLINHYNTYNTNVANFFANRDLLTINLSDSESYTKLCAFLNQDPMRAGFPKLNASI